MSMYCHISTKIKMNGGIGRIATKTVEPIKSG
jgi:hypothetical protein